MGKTKKNFEIFFNFSTSNANFKSSTRPIFFSDGLFESPYYGGNAHGTILIVCCVEKKLLIILVFPFGKKLDCVYDPLLEQPLGRFFSGMPYFEAHKMPATHDP